VYLDDYKEAASKNKPIQGRFHQKSSQMCRLSGLKVISMSITIGPNDTQHVCFAYIQAVVV